MHTNHGAPPASALPLAPLIRSFLRSLTVERHCSHNTTSAYEVNLSQFQRWLADNGFPQDTSVLSPLAVRQYIAWLKSFLAGSSIRQKVATLKGFCLFLEHELNSFTKPSLPKNVKILRPPITTLSPEQLARLLACAHHRYAQLQSLPDSPRVLKQRANCLRDTLAIALLAGTGMRVGELAGIRLADVDLQRKAILLRGKGGKQRYVFFDVPTLEPLMMDFLNWRVRQTFASDSLLLNSKTWSILSTRSIQRMLKLYLVLADLPGDISPHLLRHTYATLCIEYGANIKAISQLLGHSRVATTIAYYLHLSQEHLRWVTKSYNPLNPVPPSAADAVANRRKIVFPSLPFPEKPALNAYIF